MKSFIVSLNKGTAHKSIEDVSDTHYTKISDNINNCFVTITGSRTSLRAFLEAKHLFSPILITPQHRTYLRRINA